MYVTARLPRPLTLSLVLMNVDANFSPLVHGHPPAAQELVVFAAKLVYFCTGKYDDHSKHFHDSPETKHGASSH